MQAGCALLQIPPVQSPAPKHAPPPFEQVEGTLGHASGSADLQEPPPKQEPPSSQTSSSLLPLTLSRPSVSTSPSPQYSRLHEPLHPSPSVVLPSSHSSLGSRQPLPQTVSEQGCGGGGMVQFVLHEPSKKFPQSHSSFPAQTIESPQ